MGTKGKIATATADDSVSRAVNASTDSLNLETDTTHDLLGMMLLELQIMNSHLSILTDNVIKEEDVGL